MNYSQKSLGIFHLIEDDYHPFCKGSDILKVLRLFDETYVIEEIGFDGRYHGLAYPSSADHAQLESIRCMIIAKCKGE